MPTVMAVRAVTDVDTNSKEADDLVSTEMDVHSERLVKSAERVRDLGEVFTPAPVVQAMLDLIPDEMWVPHPSSTFLEPACGDGNFLVAVLDRKLSNILTIHQHAGLPGGMDISALRFHALEALASIYAVDISADNIVGGTPGHGPGARDRLLDLFETWVHRIPHSRVTSQSPVFSTARWIVARNVQVQNMLPTNPDGTPSGREAMPLVEYEWVPQTLSVKVSQTSFGAVMATATYEASVAQSLFDVRTPTLVWSGKATQLHKAAIPAPDDQKLPVVNRNGTGDR